jgi:hypothetical protein
MALKLPTLSCWHDNPWSIPSENKVDKVADCGTSGEVPSRAGDGGKRDLNDDDGTRVGDETCANPPGS